MEELQESPAFQALLTQLSFINSGTNGSFVKTVAMGIWRQIAEYIYIKKKDPNAPSSQWMKYMHGMNRISIIVFLFAIVVIIIKLVILPLFR